MATDSERTRIVEINGVKMEIDMRHAKVATVDHLQVGDRVKVLIKRYGGEFAVHAGTVIGFEAFQKLPTIVIAYIEKNYGSVGLKFLYFNADSKDTEIVRAADDDCLTVDRAHVEAQLQSDIDKKQAEVDDATRKLAFFRENFRLYWGETPASQPSEEAVS